MKRRKGNVKDTENYIPYVSADKATEDGLAINSFERQAQKAEFSVTDKEYEVKHKPGLKKWDRLKKKMVSVQDPRAGKIRTESGIWIPASYKTGRYADWKEKTKIEDIVKREVGEEYSGLYKKKLPMVKSQENDLSLEQTFRGSYIPILESKN